MQTASLSLEQAPPLSIPSSFFLAMPLGLLAAGAILLGSGTAALASPWMPQALALTHAGTLGVLAMGMLGALYQMTPVVAAVPVPWIRLAHLVLAGLLLGLAGFIWRLLGGPAVAMAWALTAFKLAFLAFLLPLGWALLRAETRGTTVNGMRLAVASLAVAVLLGVIMARGWVDGMFPARRMLFVQVHLTVALLGWVGGLIMAVSWQVVPMFYLAPQVGKTMMRLQTGLLLTGLLLPLVLLLAVPGGPLTQGQWAGLAAMPAVAACWVMHPLQTLADIKRRKRKRREGSLLFWKTGLCSALLLGPLGVAAVLLADPRWPLLFGWFAVWGWAGAIMHGMLGRIVPFLVWFHRFSAKVGQAGVPSMRSLLPQRAVKAGFWTHLGSLLAGGVAIVSQNGIAARLTGLLLAATAVSLGYLLVSVMRKR